MFVKTPSGETISKLSFSLRRKTYLGWADEQELPEDLAGGVASVETARVQRALRLRLAQARKEVKGKHEHTWIDATRQTLILEPEQTQTLLLHPHPCPHPHPYPHLKLNHPSHHPNPIPNPKSIERSIAQKSGHLAVLGVGSNTLIGSGWII